MARIPVEDQKIESHGSLAQDSSKTCHVTPNSPVVYDDKTCSWEMAEQGGDEIGDICVNTVEESTLRMKVEDRSAKDGEGRGRPVGLFPENGNPEREEGTAEEVVSQLKSAGRRKMEYSGAEVEGSTKGEEDSGKSVEEEGKDDEEKERKVTEMKMAVEGQHEEVSQEEEKDKKVSPKRKRRRRRRRQAEPQHGAMMKSGVCCWNINMEALLMRITKEPFLLFVFASICIICITECKPVMDETMLNVRMCAVYNDPSCPALTAIYWSNGTDDIQLWKKDMPTCKDLEPCVPCKDDGRVIVRLDEVCHKIDMEGCEGRIDYQTTVCPRFEKAQHIQVQNPDSLSSNATTTPPPDKNTNSPAQISWVVWVVGVLGVLGVLGGAIYWLVKRQLRCKRRHSKRDNCGVTDQKDDDVKTSSNLLLQDNLGQ